MANRPSREEQITCHGPGGRKKEFHRANGLLGICFSPRSMDFMGSLNDIQKRAQEQFDRQSGHYGKSHILADTADIVEALKGVEICPGMTALDVATGGGHTAVFLAERGLHVTAADLSAKMLEATAQLALDRGVSVTTRQHAAEELPYADASFDIVTCRTAAHHFSSPAQFARETARALKPGGAFDSHRRIGP
ncbi:class I SAM-dependent methyltransferase [Oscillatoria amoena NRMC-F 0135]|nr:class I SAM-dependent methyltransferase [Oscillatoria amoena NRMC-F 0135]